MKVLLYGNGSSGNHGCEAIVRGTVRLLGENVYHILSESCEEDLQYGLDETAMLLPAKEKQKKDLAFLKAYAKLKLAGVYADMDGLGYLPAIRRCKGKIDVALSVGGDNYCYGGSTGLYAYLNRAYHSQGIKTVLWGCSVEPEVVQKPDVTKDITRYDLIVARESITYEAIKKVQPNTVLAPDPAFFMPAKSCMLDERLEGDNAVGINISPMIVSNEMVSGMAYENYKNLISYILENTDSYIALIPHVVWASNDDRTVLRQLYEDFDRTSRLILVEDHTAPELKYIISHCRIFIGARTHATIAAYSGCVPTLVVGYSVKARGIARDLFGTEESYVLPVQQLVDSDQLIHAFDWIVRHEDQIREHLKQVLPAYRAASRDAINAINNLE